MNQEIKALWVAALPRYTQGRGELRNHKNEYCCLGVLCDLWSKETGKDYFDSNSCPNLLMPAQCVLDWAGLDVKVDCVEIGGKVGSLDKHNDGSYGRPQRTFAEIAKAIEEQL